MDLTCSSDFVAEYMRKTVHFALDLFFQPTFLRHLFFDFFPLSTVCNLPLPFMKCYTIITHNNNDSNILNINTHISSHHLFIYLTNQQDGLRDPSGTTFPTHLLFCFLLSLCSSGCYCRTLYTSTLHTTITTTATSI